MRERSEGSPGAGAIFYFIKNGDKPHARQIVKTICYFVVALHCWITAQWDMMSDESDKSDMSDKKHCVLYFCLIAGLYQKLIFFCKFLSKPSKNQKVASTCGGGCDMKGTVLAAFIREYFPEQLKKMDSGKHYGLTFWDPNGKGVRGRYLKHYKEGCKFYLDGACGFREMEHFLKEIGFYLGNPIINKANTQVYQFKAYEEEKQSGLRHTL